MCASGRRPREVASQRTGRTATRVRALASSARAAPRLLGTWCRGRAPPSADARASRAAMPTPPRPPVDAERGQPLAARRWASASSTRWRRRSWPGRASRGARASDEKRTKKSSGRGAWRACRCHAPRTFGSNPRRSGPASAGSSTPSSITPAACTIPRSGGAPPAPTSAAPHGGHRGRRPPAIRTARPRRRELGDGAMRRSLGARRSSSTRCRAPAPPASGPPPARGRRTRP